ncbi:hypothetical protein FOZ60_011683 [Perkinsus olseni]|uniref:Integrase catalytic domain-containing protein n=1 Tax=Perkinsus olseni TaxID=32597 RepID=A0A7J6NCU9_PEROL|nr:hypothetical protein FOZ60_011683 [Perkinsus olseni]
MHAAGERDADTDWCCDGCPGHLLPSPETHAIYEDGVRLVEECLPFVTPEIQTTAFVDNCCLTRDVSSVDSPSPSYPLVRRLKECSWGAGDMFYMVAVMRWCLKTWKTLSQDPNSTASIDYPTVWDRPDLLVVVRSDQHNFPSVPPCSEVGRGTGPYFRIDSVVHLRSAGPTGIVEYKPYVSPYLRDILLRDIHRSNDHCSPSYARSQLLTGYCSTRVTIAARQICRKQCALCIQFARKAKWTLPVGGPMFDIRTLLTSPSYPPYEAIGVDYVTVEGIKVVSFCCVATRHMTLIYTPTESTSGLIMAFQEFMMLWGTPRIVLSDRASYFKSVLWNQFLKSHNILSWLNASVAPWEGSYYERLHGIVRTILRPMLLIPYTRRMLREFDPRSVQDVRSLRLLLLEVSLLLNTRPLTIDCEDGVITPDSLVQGYTRSTSSTSLPSPIVETGDAVPPVPDCVGAAAVPISPSAAVLPSRGPDTAPRRVAAVRRVFLDYHFRRLKERSNAQFHFNGQWKAFEVGSPVFIQAAKSIVPARILEAYPARDGVVRRYKVRFLRSDHETVISHANIAAAFPWESLVSDDDP